MIVPFKYYVHDNADSEERIGEIAGSAGILIDEELEQKIGRPFYEVQLNCTLDTETGAVVITSAER